MSRNHLETKSPPTTLYRLGRIPNPWQLPDWSRANPDGTFGNRFDDPESYYRVLYAATQELCCYVECLASFRPDLTLLAEFSQIDGDDDFLPLGTVPRDWFKPRLLGSAKIAGTYADIYAVEWVAFLRHRLASDCLRLGIADLDSGILQTAPRAITQLASLEAYKQDFSGIYYRSRYGHNLENWALFEPLNILSGSTKPILPDDPIAKEAFKILGIRLE